MDYIDWHTSATAQSISPRSWCCQEGGWRMGTMERPCSVGIPPDTAGPQLASQAPSCRARLTTWFTATRGLGELQSEVTDGGMSVCPPQMGCRGKSQPVCQSLLSQQRCLCVSRAAHPTPEAPGPADPAHKLRGDSLPQSRMPRHIPARPGPVCVLGWELYRNELPHVSCLRT